ncbi:MAG: hypothetical protein U9N35_01425 [Euryarchaeota archaeon]|nr:hypothetical protein [Euryarchaeota archaeon]
MIYAAKNYFPSILVFTEEQYLDAIYFCSLALIISMIGTAFRKE